MPNTMTALLPVAFAEAKRIVQRETAGFVLGADTRFDASQVGQGQTITFPVVTKPTAGTFTPAATPTAADSTASSVTLSLSTASKHSWHLTGEQMRAWMAGTPGDILMDWQRQNIGQGIRIMVNAMDAAIAAMHTSAHYAYGTAATTPCGSSLVDIAKVKALLNREGYNDDLQLVVDSAAAANILTNAGDASKVGGTDQILDGDLGRLFGVSCRTSANVLTHTKGTGSSDTVSAAAYAVGATAITTSGFTGGAYVAGDCVTFGTGAEKYVVGSIAPTTEIMTINGGLKVALTGSEAIALSASHTANVAFPRSAVLLACRPPAIPVGGQVTAYEVITDEVTGLSFGLVEMVGYGMVMYEVLALYGHSLVNPAGIVKLLG